MEPPKEAVGVTRVHGFTLCVPLSKHYLKVSSYCWILISQKPFMIILRKETITRRTNTKPSLHPRVELSETLSGAAAKTCDVLWHILLHGVPAVLSVAVIMRIVPDHVTGWPGLFHQSYSFTVIHPFPSLPGALGRMKSYMLLWSLWAKNNVGSNLCGGQMQPHIQQAWAHSAASHCYTSRQSLLSAPPCALPSLSELWFFFSFYSFQICSLYSKISD